MKKSPTEGMLAIALLDERRSGTAVSAVLTNLGPGEMRQVLERSPLVRVSFIDRAPHLITFGFACLGDDQVGMSGPGRTALTFRIHAAAMLGVRSSAP